MEGEGWGEEKTEGKGKEEEEWKDRWSGVGWNRMWGWKKFTSDSSRDTIVQAHEVTPRKNASLLLEQQKCWSESMLVIPALRRQRVNPWSSLPYLVS